MSSRVFLECHCSEKKYYQLRFDNGNSQDYVVTLCKTCYQKDDKKFLINEESVCMENIPPLEGKIGV